MSLYKYIYYFYIAECQGKDVKECCEKPTQYTHHALPDVDSVHFSPAPKTVPDFGLKTL